MNKKSKLTKIKESSQDVTELTFGFYGSMANNMYSMSKTFGKYGLSSKYFMQMRDTYPMSQPVWEDCKFTLRYEMLQKNWTREEWNKFQSKLDFFTENVIVDSEKKVRKNYRINLPNLSSWFYFIFLLILYGREFKTQLRIIENLRKCDILIVCGAEPEILAWFSGVPYIIWPHGGDIRFASGYEKNLSKSIFKRVTFAIKKYLLNLAFNDCLFIGSHDPTGACGELVPNHFPIDRFPFPLQPNFSRINKKIQYENLSAVFKQFDIEIPHKKYYIFVPSRIDFFWKGTDILLRALKRVSLDQIVIIFSGWGADYTTALNAVKCSKNIQFLPFALSKPHLHRIYANVDLVIDQFKMGSYGTSMVEAMSHGTPVMMRLNEKLFMKRNWESPPVANVSTEDEIVNILINIERDAFDFLSLRNKTQKWFLNNHDVAVVVPEILKEISKKLI